MSCATDVGFASRLLNVRLMTPAPVVKTADPLTAWPPPLTAPGAVWKLIDAAPAGDAPETIEPRTNPIATNTRFINASLRLYGRALPRPTMATRLEIEHAGCQ